MSYIRTFSRTISVPYSVTVNYPASQSGGSVTRSGTATETVVVEIEVDTNPFDASVGRCNDHVNGLTASVGTMNAAQCAAISENAAKVSQTLIDGFFHTVRTDLSTQRAELEQRIESRLLLLRQQAASLQDKRRKMEEDYARTTARYQKLFADLNNELSIRIHEVDQPVFNFANEVDAQNDRMLHTDMIQTAITTSRESSLVQSQLNVARVKHDALSAMNRVQNFLVEKASSERTLQTACTDGNGTDRYLAPVCYIETESENMQVKRQCLAPRIVSSGGNAMDGLCNALADVDFSTPVDSEIEMLQSYFQAEVAQNIKGNDAHSDRVKAMINKLFNR
ncbi:MAG: hypothetical protein E7070_02385 [Bacteroidales bacterium]|jgi:hypothetical protein|nr:hypothetical protein [Bacteroidales bacterium]